MTKHSTNSSLRFACEIEFIHPKCANIMRISEGNSVSTMLITGMLITVFYCIYFFVSLLISSVNYDLYVAVY